MAYRVIFLGFKSCKTPLDWQTHVGFNIGVSYKYVTIGEGGGLPGMYVG